ncbi:acetyl/propionyl/methylcrotonyl-CoA carboxylase subunit alpha [Naumannella halotolerans]|uniref:acetyl/propionyl/methylcrotonyl-CoA carboxylase subunit alpha n=1 Tax=Naumannella halotolerans TaxID=993414 RepID=UPI00370D382E
MAISKVLVANRGEIAVRVIRAARDAGIGSVAVYAEPDAEALFVRLADEAWALGGETAADSYLSVEKILSAASASGADAVHPGYGFLAENATFARAVIEAGLTWIGPPPEAIEVLGDKVRARRLAQQVGAPLVPGTADPVADADAVLAFATEHGLPIAIKAAHGGGGRGMKVARELDEIAELFDSATRESTAAFGRGECFVERYLDRPRHVETQCLADVHGNVVVVSTRDCSLQRRFQKLVEEAPAPYLSDEQEQILRTASTDILRAAGYVGAGTCEFLIGVDGAISFLEVNTRLQVEHPVTEEVTGIDLVREMFRIADGEDLGYTDPPPRGHSIEFRINAEEPAADFLPAAGTLTAWQAPTGPGVRVDEGYLAGMRVPNNFDSLIAKLIITGADRQQAIERARRALSELVVEGMPTVVPFHRAVLGDPAFTAVDGAFAVHTRWIETEWDNQLAPYAGPAGEAAPPVEMTELVVEVNGKRLPVRMPVGHTAAPGRMPGPRRRSTPRATASAGPAAASALVSPMQGTIVKVLAADGDEVAAGDPIVILEAMKMEQPLKAHRAGVVTGLQAEVGQSVSGGSVICDVVDAG